MKVRVKWDRETEEGLDTETELPEVVTVPFEVIDDAIVEWLSDEHGFLVDDIQEVQ